MAHRLVASRSQGCTILPKRSRPGCPEDVQVPGVLRGLGRGRGKGSLVGEAEGLQHLTSTHAPLRVDEIVERVRPTPPEIVHQGRTSPNPVFIFRRQRS